MRVVREVATAHARGLGIPTLHAAAVAGREGRGATLFLGAKRAGKTSVLVYLLSQPGFRYIANDRVMLDTGTDPVSVIGVPTIVQIREGTLDLFAALGARLRESRFRASRMILEPATREDPQGDAGVHRVSPAQLRALMGAETVGTAPLRAAHFLDIAEGPAFAIRRLTPEEATARLTRDGLLAGGTAATFLTQEGDVASAERSGLPMRELAARIPCFSCTLGPTAYRTGELRECLDT
jgi:hypothetical protein